MTIALRKAAKPVTETPDTKEKLSKLIDAAPDSGKAKGVIQGKKRQISVAFDPEFLDEIDVRRKEMGDLSRPAFIALACKHLIRQGIVIGGRESE